MNNVNTFYIIIFLENISDENLTRTSTLMLLKLLLNSSF